MSLRYLINTYSGIFFVLIFAGFTGCKTNQNKQVGIQVLGAFDNSLIDSLSNSILEVYGFEVALLTKQDLPEYAFTNVKSPRYRADKIIKNLRVDIPDSIDFVLGLIRKDISTTKKDKNGNVLEPAYKYEDWGVFGLGYRPGESCVVSTFRIKNVKRQKLVERFQKICIHEIGHNLGLKHCPNENCVMRDAAESIKTIDNVQLNLCESCRNEI